MPMYNLLEYNQKYSMTSGNLWNYYRDKIDDVIDNVFDGKSFKHETEIVEKSSEKTEIPEHPPQLPPNPDVSEPPQPLAPALNAEVTIRLK